MDTQSTQQNARQALQALQTAIDDEETLHQLETTVQNDIEEEHTIFEDEGVGIGTNVFEAFLRQTSSELTEDEIEQAVNEFGEGLHSQF